MIIKENGGKSFDPVPAGVTQGVCYAVVDIGTHIDPTFNKAKRQVIICWETPNETINIEGKEVPRTISAFYTASLGKKANLRAMLDGWRGRPFTDEELKGFELNKVLGVNCLLNVIHEPSKKDPSKKTAKIKGVTPLAKGMANLKPVNPVLAYDIPEEGEFSIPDTVPEWIKARIVLSEEYKARNGSGQHTEAQPDAPAEDSQDDSSIPF